ncbi:MAG: hypothetical protein U0271_03505 [Polyangiaceae bacterium]
MRRELVLLAASYAVLAALVSFAAMHSVAFARLIRPESLHIVMHMLMYGGLAFLGLRAGMSVRGSGVLATLAAVVQELAQDATVWRPPGAPEVFDLAVDSVAIAAVLLGARPQK